MLGFNTTETVLLAAVLYVVYLVGLGVWRTAFHPLARFPGPRIAAITRLYECYFDVYLGGQYFKEIERLHSVYGPVVRISPHELHIKDPEWVTELYPPGNRIRHKYAWFLSEGTDATSSATVHHHVHRQRRSTLAPSFSKQSVMGVEDSVVQANIDIMCSQLDKFAVDGTPIVLATAFSSVTLDSVLQIWFGVAGGETRHWDFFPSWTEAIPPLLTASHLLRHFPKAFLMFGLVPQSSWDRLVPGVSMIFNLQKASANLAQQAMEGTRGEAKASVFEKLRKSSLPQSERSLGRLSDEGFSFVMASTESTALTLAAIFYHLVDNPNVLDELRIHLSKEGSSWSDLENIPYFRNVVNEAMRVTALVTGRLTRVAPNETLRYQNWEIPPGTPVSMDHHFTHLDPTIFPEPRRFNPDRWHIAAEKGEPLDRYFLPFGRGSRMCIGINLAKCIIYRTIAAVLCRYDFELYQTTREDVDVVRDNLLGAIKPGSPGVRVTLSRRE